MRKYRTAVLCLIGYILIPAYYLIPALMHIHSDLNYTGVLQHPFFLCSSVAILIWFLFLLHRLSVGKKKLVILAVMMILPLVLPYGGSRLLSEFHVLAGYALFVYVSLLLIPLFQLYGLAHIYAAVTACAVLYSFSMGEVTWLSEGVYGAAVSVLMTRCVQRKNRII
ncbi:MAG: hypothetical protein K6G61_02055 [Solobacterium sp.]|nr:hypothetical protein [Solobacterium sp.]